MGRDKYENEELIRWGWPEDIWFHVDDHSSAHVYVRMPKGKGMDDLTDEMIEECCQLTKQNSIAGCKLNNVKIVFTPWSNLHKTNGMEAGQVGFHSEKLRRYFTVDRKNTTILNRLEKTKVEKDNVDFRTEREQRDAEVRRLERVAEKDKKDEERKLEEERKRLSDLKHYAALNDETLMTHTNANPGNEDDFM
jgi:predicted ribosome quality control (RQC) complex YloA/Tae2 family protein